MNTHSKLPKADKDPPRITESKIHTSKYLCVTCETCGTKPEITWQGDGYGAICQCIDVFLMPWNSYPDQAMRSWNRCFINGNWSITSQRKSREDIAGKRATYIRNMFTPLNELYEGGVV